MPTEHRLHHLDLAYLVRLLAGSAPEASARLDMLAILGLACPGEGKFVITPKGLRVALAALNAARAELDAFDSNAAQRSKVMPPALDPSGVDC